MNISCILRTNEFAVKVTKFFLRRIQKGGKGGKRVRGGGEGERKEGREKEGERERGGERKRGREG